MHRHPFAVLSGLVSLLATTAAATAVAQAEVAVAIDGVAHPLSGPYVHENLSVYLVHGPDRIGAIDLVPLEQALADGLAVVHETGSVNELTVENTSKTATIFVQPGDLVRGGKQDRIFGAGLLIPPSSGAVPISAFCVESGRWSPRRGESAVRFDSAANFAASSELKVASRAKGIEEITVTGSTLGRSPQRDVWTAVSNLQLDLVESLGAPVRDASSETSLELTLASDAVQASTKKYVDALDGIGASRDDVVGFVAAINGRAQSAEIYGSHALFGKLWPKMLRAAAVEAAAERGAQGEPARGPALAEVAAFLARSADRREVPEELNAITRYTTIETGDTLETRTSEKDAGWVHRSYVAKPGATSDGLER